MPQARYFWSGQGFANVTFGNTSVVNNNDHNLNVVYVNQMDKVGDVQAGDEATVDITMIGEYFAVAIWVDWNNNVVFDDDELVAFGNATTDFSFNFDVPNVTPGNYTMRIGCSYDFASQSDADPCLNGNYAIFEDYTLQVTEAPACMAVSNLVAENITANTADLSWTVNGENQVDYQVVVSTTELADPSTGEALTATTNSYSLENLTAQTTYYVYVRANCGDEDGLSTWKSVSFITPCTTYTITEDTPFTENFDSYTALSSTYLDENEYSTAVLPSCWTFINRSESAISYPQAYLLTSTSYAVDGNCLFFKSSDVTPLYAVLPAFSNNIEELLLEFTYRNESSYNYNGTLSVGVMTDIADPSTFVELMSCEITNVKTDKTLNFATSGQTGSKYIVFKYIGGNSNYYLSIDNVKVRVLSTGNDILSFVLADQTGDAVIDPEFPAVDCEISFTADITAQTPVITVSPNATITPASGATQDFTNSVLYTVTSEAGVPREWLVTVTKAAANTEAFITDFTFAGQKAETTATIVSDTENNVYTVNAVAEWNTDLTSVSPVIAISRAATINPANGETQDFSSEVTYTVTAEDGITAHTYTVNIVNDPDACVNPALVTVSNIEATTADLSWAQSYTETSYRVKVSSVAMTDMTATADAFDEVVEDVQLALTGLTPNTEYFVYVQSNCENAENWTEVSFRTQCVAYEITEETPFVDNFDSYEENSLPDCWAFINNHDDYTYPYVWVRQNSSYAVEQNCLFFVSSASTPIYAVLPAVTNNIEDLVLEFVYKCESSSSGILSVGVITDISDASTFTEVQSYERTTTKTSVTLDFATTGQTGNKYIVFKYGDGSSNNYYLGIDNVTVRVKSTGNDIVEYTFPMQMSDAVINAETATVTANASYQADLNNIGETVEVSPNAAYTLTNTVVEGNVVTKTYTVTSEVGVDKEWTATITKADAASTANDIVEFTFAEQVGESVIDTEAKTVNAIAEWDADLTNIVPTIVTSPMSTINPESGVAQDFTNAVSYAVTAEDGTSVANWTVTIVNDPNACVNPDVFTISDITTESAMVTWEQAYLETEYRVMVSTEVITDFTATANVIDETTTDRTYTLTGLTATTKYYVYVASVCEDAVNDVAQAICYTECSEEARTIPYAQSFTDDNADVRCWEVVDANNDGATWDFNGAKMYYSWNYNNNANDWLISPKIAIIDGASLTFEYYTEGYTEKFSVYVLTDVNDLTTATQILGTQSVTNYNPATISPIDLSAYAGQEIYIGIKAESNSNMYNLYVQNFEVTAKSTIVATAGANGTITPEGNVEVVYGEDQTFTFTPAEGYRVATVTVDDEAVEVTENAYTFENVTENHTINVTFEAFFTITATAGENGTISPEGVVEVVEGGEQIFTFTPAEGYRVATVTVDDEAVEVTENAYTFENVTENHTINVTFEAFFTITATAGENGTITPNGEVVVIEGATQTFEIAANEGYEIASVMVDEVEAVEDVVDGVYTFTNVTANHTIAVTFSRINFTITATADANGTIEGPATVAYGEDAEYVITPNTGYRIATVVVDDVDAIEDVVEGVYTFENVTANHTIAVTFVEIETSIDVIEAGSISAYPNPNNGLFAVDFSAIEGEAVYQLIDVKGAMIDSREINVMNGETMNFNYDLRPGTYYVRIITNDNVYVEQIVVE